MGEIPVAGGRAAQPALPDPAQARLGRLAPGSNIASSSASSCVRMACKTAADALQATPGLPSSRDALSRDPELLGQTRSFIPTSTEPEKPGAQLPLLGPASKLHLNSAR